MSWRTGAARNSLASNQLTVGRVSIRMAAAHDRLLWTVNSYQPTTLGAIVTEPVITVAWTETRHYRTRLTLAEAREVLVDDYRADLVTTRTASELSELLAELDLDDQLAGRRADAYTEPIDFDVEWIKPE